MFFLFLLCFFLFLFLVFSIYIPSLIYKYYYHNDLGVAPEFFFLSFSSLALIIQNNNNFKAQGISPHYLLLPERIITDNQ